MDSSISSAPDSGGDAGAQVCVTLDSLSINGEPPAIGDQVDLHGTVASINGENAYVQVDNSMNDDSSAGSEDGSQLRQQLGQDTTY